MTAKSAAGPVPVYDFGDIVAMVLMAIGAPPAVNPHLYGDASLTSHDQAALWYRDCTSILTGLYPADIVAVHTIRNQLYQHFGAKGNFSEQTRSHFRYESYADAAATAGETDPTCDGVEVCKHPYPP